MLNVVSETATIFVSSLRKQCFHFKRGGTAADESLLASYVIKKRRARVMNMADHIVALCFPTSLYVVQLNGLAFLLRVFISQDWRIRDKKRDLLLLAFNNQLFILKLTVDGTFTLHASVPLCRNKSGCKISSIDEWSSYSPRNQIKLVLIRKQCLCLVQLSECRVFECLNVTEWLYSTTPRSCRTVSQPVM